MSDIARLLIVLGGGLLLLGVVLLVFTRVSGINQIPGNFQFQFGNMRIFLPLGTMLLISLLLTLVLNILARWFR